jgi:NAD(P)H-flavin reductase
MPEPLLTEHPPVEGPGPVDPMLPRPFRVVDVHYESPNVRTLLMEPADGGPSIVFDAGQIGMISLPGVGEVPISFSSDPRDHQRVTMTIRAVGAVTVGLTSLSRGSIVGLRGPYGTAWPIDEAADRDMLVITGGLGLCPLRSLVVEAAARRSVLRSLTVIHGARSPSDLLFKVDLEKWRRRPELDVLLTVDHADPGWHGNVGVPTTLFDRAIKDPANTIAMLCGPDVMLRIVGQALIDWGVPADRVWVTMERNMKCGIGLCGHCQMGPLFVCRDGPIFRFDRVSHLFSVEEV